MPNLETAMPESEAIATFLNQLFPSVIIHFPRNIALINVKARLGEISTLRGSEGLHWP